ncbi:MAG: hypothetical protein VKP57_08065 [Candidatus Sericytochromatia bacterium]|nr:hypothetical protein [Candidatus Sericytochromatia bacterium]
MDFTEQVRQIRDDLAPKVSLDLTAAEGTSARKLCVGWRNRLSTILGRAELDDLEGLLMLTNAVSADLRANPIRRDGMIPVTRIMPGGIRQEHIRVLFHIEGLRVHAAPRNRWRYIPEGRLEIRETGECVAWTLEGSTPLPAFTLSRESWDKATIDPMILNLELFGLSRCMKLDTEIWIHSTTDACLGDVLTPTFLLSSGVQRAPESFLRHLERQLTARLAARPIVREMEVSADTVADLDLLSIEDDEFLPRSDHLEVRVTGVRLGRLGDGRWCWAPTGHAKASYYSLHPATF